MIAVISGPAFLLCSYLALLCYRQARYRHTLVLTLIAVLMLSVTLGVVWASYYTGLVLKRELALVLSSPFLRGLS